MRTLDLDFSAMSEFKFACPVCSQHITADSNGAASEIECPTCFRKIVVPQGPTSSDPKFILSAAEVNKPRPTQSGGTVPIGTVPTAGGRTAVPISLVLFLIVACAAGAALFLLR